jgi:hypothetical protein
MLRHIPITLYVYVMLLPSHHIPNKMPLSDSCHWYQGSGKCDFARLFAWEGVGILPLTVFLYTGNRPSLVEAPIWLEISYCSYSETRFALTKNTRRK